MGIEEKNEKVMWYGVYNKLANLLYNLDKLNQRTKGEALYSLCIENEKFLKLHAWAEKSIDKKIRSKRTGKDFNVSSFDPMQIFASFNGFGMREDRRIEKINLYFEILGSNEKYEKIDFTGCPSPIIIALISNRNPETIEEIWKAFDDIINNGKNAKIDFGKIKKDWHGISIESFTVLLFWIDSRNFLPLDKNTLSLFETNNATVSYDNWEEYKDQLIKKDTDIYQVIAKMAWNCNDELVKYKDELNDFGIEKCPNKSLKIIAIKPLKGCNKDFLKGLKEEQIYLFDKAYIINNETIKYDKEKDIQLFNQDNLQININAIVGKNGTGKSTLVELLLAVINNVTYQQQEKKCTISIEELKVELIFEDLDIYKVKIDNDDIRLFKYENKWIEITSINSKNIFYNILVNYSIHSLNTNEEERDEEKNWIEPHFENDCDTNIMIEPFRKNGNINIHEEEKKVKKRLIVNLLEPETEGYSFRRLTQNLKAVKLTSSTRKSKYTAKETIGNKKIYNIDDLSREIQDKSSSIEDDYFEDIILSNGTTELKLSNLSSGEKQKIYSINSIIYHIKEIDRKKKNKHKNKPKHINLILDEIELYFHPELQRTYISDIISAIKKVGTENLLGINITFITHSPFILSDIPESKILFLEKNDKGKTVSKSDIKQTFGANIHTLLSDSFFMEDGLMGEFAKGKINEIKRFYEKVIDEKKIEENIEFYNKHQEKFWQIQKIIGEPFLQKIVKNQLEEIELILLGRDEAIDNEIARLQALKVSSKNA